MKFEVLQVNFRRNNWNYIQNLRQSCILTSIPQIAFICPSRFGVVAQLVRAPACHAGGRGFESRLSRHSHISSGCVSERLEPTVKGFLRFQPSHPFRQPATPNDRFCRKSESISESTKQTRLLIFKRPRLNHQGLINILSWSYYITTWPEKKLRIVVICSKKIV